MCACEQKTETNPFFTEFRTEYGAPDFDKIKIEHYEPAFLKGIEEQNAEIKAIVESRETPGFENTIVALDNSGRTLARVKGVFYALTEADTNDEMSALSEKIAPVLSEHNDNIYLNQDLYKRVAAVWQQEQEGKITLTTEQQKDYKEKIEADMKAQDNLIASIEAQIKAEEAAANASKNNSSNNSSNSNNNSGNNSNSGSTSYDGGAFKWPTVSTRITSPYGDTEGRTSPHQGIDIGAVVRGVSGDPIYAAADGKVVISQFSSSAGNYIMIYHGNGLYTRYLHASSLLVSVGTYVTKGQTIALMGTTGNSDGVHLHFDVRLNGSVVNPWNYLSK